MVIMQHQLRQMEQRRESRLSRGIQEREETRVIGLAELRFTGGRSDIDVSPSGLRWVVALTLGVLALLVFAPSAIAGKPIVNSLGNDFGGTTGGLFEGPRGVAVNNAGTGGAPAGTFYVADAGNNRIQQFGPDASFVRTWGSGVRDGEEEFEICVKAESCRGGNAGPGAGLMSSPQSIAVDQSTGTLYVVDQGNRRIDVFSAKGVFEGAFGWGARDGSPEFQFCTSFTGCSPPNRESETGGQAGKFGARIGGLSADPSGNVYVADETNRRVDVFMPVFTSGVVTGASFLRAFGKDVSTVAGTGYEVCTGVNCKRGGLGAGAGEFQNNSPTAVAVDAAGSIYAADTGNGRIQKFDSTPAPVDPTFGKLAIEATFGTAKTGGLPTVDLATDHLFIVGLGPSSSNHVRILELDSTGVEVATHGMEIPTSIALGLGVASEANGGNLYLSTFFIAPEESETKSLIGVWVLNNTKPSIDSPACSAHTALLSGTVVSNGLDVTYHFEYSIDGKAWTRISEADVDAGTAVGTIPASQEATGLTGSQSYRFRLVSNRPLGGGSATSGEASCVTSPSAPVILSSGASQITTSAATLNATLNPQNQATVYHFEYVDQEEFEAHGYANATKFPSSDLSAGSGGVSVQLGSDLTGLAPGTTYHFHIVAENTTGSTTGGDQVFTTYPEPGPNDRAYELVSPPETNGRSPIATGFEGFGVTPAVPAGESVSVFFVAPLLSGVNGTGVEDPYEAVRTPQGWNTGLVGPSGAQVERFFHLDGVSPDHRYSIFRVAGKESGNGTLEKAFLGAENNYIRKPDGSFELVGFGETGSDPDAMARWVSAGASHIIFTNDSPFDPKEALEGNAPPVGTATIYDRTPSGTHVVSLLPPSVTPASGQSASYLGASVDGTAVVFSIEGTMYVRRDNASTVQVGSPGAIFAGISRNGDTVHYIEGESFFSFDVGSQTSTPIAASASPVNVSADGSHAYFVSELALTGAETNENGEIAEAGKSNFYVWEDASEETRFIGIVSNEDVTGFIGLTAWVNQVLNPTPNVTSGPANDPSRSTPDGEVLVFESHANLTGYDSEGHVEIYRYEVSSGKLACLSCSPIDAPAESDARLEKTQILDPASPLTAVTRIANVTDDGATVFFQTGDALVTGDVDGVDDVYEWKEGRISMVSSGHSPLSNYLYGMTPDGNDVFFTTNDRLVPADPSELGSIYDARIGGGFPEASENGACELDSCQGQGTPAPALAGAASAAFQGSGNAKARHSKPKHHGHRKKHRGHRKKRRTAKRHQLAEAWVNR